MRRSRKPLSVVRRIEGSNPSPSAFQAGLHRNPASAAGAHSRLTAAPNPIDAHGCLRKSTGFVRHWRTTGAPSVSSRFGGGELSSPSVATSQEEQ
jgi:hypothetical protein